MAQQQQLQPQLLQAVHQRNTVQKMVLVDKIRAHFGDRLDGKVFGLWGLAFKPGTDDMREAPSQVVIEALLAAGARVKAYDPVAMEAARRELPADWFSSGALELCNHQYDALAEVNALVLVTEWKPFRHPDFGAMKRLMAQPVIFDGRNQYDPPQLVADGFTYYGIGRAGKMRE
jgi:UDPglucose 6-dehydrogenase